MRSWARVDVWSVFLVNGLAPKWVVIYISCANVIGRKRQAMSTRWMWKQSETISAALWHSVLSSEKTLLSHLSIMVCFAEWKHWCCPCVDSWIHIAAAVCTYCMDDACPNLDVSGGMKMCQVKTNHVLGQRNTYRLCGPFLYCSEETGTSARHISARVSAWLRRLNSPTCSVMCVLYIMNLLVICFVCVLSIYLVWPPLLRSAGPVLRCRRRGRFDAFSLLFFGRITQMGDASVFLSSERTGQQHWLWAHKCAREAQRKLKSHHHLAGFLHVENVPTITAAMTGGRKGSIILHDIVSVRCKKSSQLELFRSVGHRRGWSWIAQVRNGVSFVRYLEIVSVLFVWMVRFMQAKHCERLGMNSWPPSSA